MKNITCRLYLSITCLCSALIFTLAVPALSHADEPFIGEIKMFGGNFAPEGYAFCDGQLLPIMQNQTLFSLLGTTYGGDGRTSFALPDLRGRVPIHSSSIAGPGLTKRGIGERGGAETTTLAQSQMPVHSHGASASIAVNSTEGEAPTPVPTNGFLAKSSDGAPLYSASSSQTSGVVDTMAPGAVSVTVGNSGGNQPHNNMQPYLGINYIIALEGVFPSRY